jgi:hypothetical protein
MTTRPPWSTKPKTRLVSPPGYLFCEDAWERLGMRKMTFLRRVKALGIPVYAHSQDARRRLIRREDVERLKEPMLIA